MIDKFVLHLMVEQSCVQCHYLGSRYFYVFSKAVQLVLNQHLLMNSYFLVLAMVSYPIWFHGCANYGDIIVVVSSLESHRACFKQITDV